MNGEVQSGSDDSARALIAGCRPRPFALKTRTARLVARFLGALNGACVSYRYFHGGELRRELSGRGVFIVERHEDGLRCRIQGELHRPTPFEFCFHHFHLTGRGVLAAVFALADDRPREQRGASEPFLHFETGADFRLRREAAAFLARFARNRGRPRAVR